MTNFGGYMTFEKKHVFCKKKFFYDCHLRGENNNHFSKKIYEKFKKFWKKSYAEKGLNALFQPDQAGNWPRPENMFHLQQHHSV